MQSGNSERGFQSFAFHPEFAQTGGPGYGRFYTWLDTSDMTAAPDFTPSGNGRTHDKVLLEWTAKNARAATYDGAAPRELFRVAHPFANHNGGQIAFNPLARAGTPEFGLLYIGSADGGSGGDPYNHAQNLGSVFGKILRIDPLGRNSKNGKYGIPAANPFTKLPTRLARCIRTGIAIRSGSGGTRRTATCSKRRSARTSMKRSIRSSPAATTGGTCGRAASEYFNREVSTDDQRSDPKMIYPIVDFDHTDPLLQRLAAATGIYAYRDRAVPQLTNKLIFGDNPSGEIFYVDADALPKGGQNFHRVLFIDNGETKTLLQLIRDKDMQQGRMPAPRRTCVWGWGRTGSCLSRTSATGSSGWSSP